MNLNSLKSQTQKLNRRDLIIFLIPTIIFSLYLSVYNPGILTIDSFNQLHQIATGNYNNYHPFLYTFIEMLLLKIYASPMTVGVFQILAFSAIWTAICKYHRNDSIESDLFKIQILITLIISIIPINAIYSITLWKDVPFAYAILLLTFLIKVTIDKKGKIDYMIIIPMAVSLALIAGLRSNGIFITVITLIALAIYLYKKNPEANFHLTLPAVAVVFIILIASLSLAFDVDDTQRDDVYIKTAHMLADYDLNLDIEGTDKAAIGKLINESKLNTTYNIYYADPISWISNKQVYDEHAGNYLALAFRYSVQNPMHALFYLAKSADIVWDVTRDGDWTGQPYYINGEGANVETAKEKYFTSINATPKESFEDVTDTNIKSAPYSLLNAFVNAARGDLVLGTLFNSPALYMYLAVLLMILISVITKSRDIYLIYLPNLANIIIVFATATVQDNRFLYANLLVCYLLIIVSASILVKENIEKSQMQKPKETAQKLPEARRPQQEMETQEEMEARIRAKIIREMEMERKYKKR